MLNVHKSFILAWDIWLRAEGGADEKWVQRWSYHERNRGGWLKISNRGDFLEWHALAPLEVEIEQPFWRSKVKDVWLYPDDAHGYAAWRAFIELSNQGLRALIEARENENLTDRLDQLCDAVFPAVHYGRRVHARASAEQAPRYTTLLYVEPDWDTEETVDLDSAVAALNLDFGLRQGRYRPRLVGDMLLTSALGTQKITEAATAFYLPHALQREVGALGNAPYLKSDDIVLPSVVEDTWEYLRYSVVARDLTRRADLLPLRSEAIGQLVMAVDAEPLMNYQSQFLPERARECTERSRIADSLASLQKSIATNPLHKYLANPDSAGQTPLLSFSPPASESVLYGGVSEALEALIAWADEKCSSIEAAIRDSESKERLLADFFRDSTTVAATEASLSLQRTIRWLTAVAAIAAIAQLATVVLQMVEG